LVYFVLNYQYRKKHDVDTKEYATAKDQVIIAESLKKSNEKIAEQLKNDTYQRIEEQTHDLKKEFSAEIKDVRKDMTHGFQVNAMELASVHQIIANVIEKAVDAAKLNAETAARLQIQIDKNQTHMERLEQFEWGRDAKSIPGYMTEEGETQEHRDKPEEGLFKDPDNNKK